MFCSLLLAYPHLDDIFGGCFLDDFLDYTKVHGNYSFECVPYTLCFNRKNKTWDIDYMDKYNSIIVGGHMMDYKKIMYNPKYQFHWDTLFSDINNDISKITIRRDLLRLLLNPSRNIRNLIYQEKVKILKYPYTIGVQLRMGGNYSNNPENYEGVPFHRIPQVVDQVRAEIVKNNWQSKVQVFITSDSSKVIIYFRELVNNEFPVVESTLFLRGHNSLNKKQFNAITANIIADFYYMSLSNHLFITWPSTIGRMMCYISEANCTPVLNWTIDHKQIPFPTE